MNNLMFTIKRILKNKNTVTIVGTVAIIAILYFGFQAQVRSKTDPVNIPVAIKKIDAGTLITDDMIGSISVPRNFLDRYSNVIRSRGLVVGKFTKEKVTIPLGGIIYSDMIGTQKENSIITNLKANERLFSLPVDLESTFGNKIYPNTVVDVYMKATINSGIVVGRLLASAKVLAVQDYSGRDVFESSEETRIPAKLLFALDCPTYLLMKKADYLDQFGVELFPVPLGGTIDETQLSGITTKVSTSYLQNFINASTVTITENDLQVDTSCLVSTSSESTQ